MIDKLLPFQWEGVQSIYRFRGRALLADEMGLGKTIQALAWIHKTPKHRPAVIVCPASLKYVWEAEAARWFRMRAVVLEGRCPGKRVPVPGEIIIINYDILFSWLPSLQAVRPRTIIIDEIHYCTNIRAQRTRAVYHLSKKASSVVGLSGTPLKNRSIELWSPLSIIRPDIFPSREAYAWRYCSPRPTPWGFVYDGSRNTAELRRILLRECMIRRRRKDVKLQLPERQRRVIPFKLESLVEYKHACENFLTWLGTTNPGRVKRARRNQALVKIGYLFRLIAELKLPHTIQWIRDFFTIHPGEKLVCLTMHTKVIDELKKVFPKAIILDGRVTGKLRHLSVRKFQSNGSSNLILGNWLAAGYGITLTAAHNLAALDTPWTPGDLLQGEDRINRIGQKSDHVIMHYLVARGTIEEKRARMLRDKTNTLYGVLDGGADHQDVDIFNQLIQEIKRA